MYKFVSCRCLSGAAILLFLGQAATAQQAAGLDSCRAVLTSTGAGPGQTAYCQKRAVDARNDLLAEGIDPRGLSDIDAIERADLEYDTKRANAPMGADTQTPDEKREELRIWGVTAQGLSDAQVRDRWTREYRARFLAELQADHRKEESDRLHELARQDADAAERQRIDAIASQATQSAEGMRQAAELARVQGDAALRSLGVDPDALNSDDDDVSDAEADAFGLRMYQQMIDNGLAPQCKGKTGDDLIDCVDAALDSDE